MRPNAYALSLAIIAPIIAVALLGCAHPLPEVRCDDYVHVQGPAEAGDEIARACQRYADAAGFDLGHIRRALTGTRVIFSDQRSPPSCSMNAPACVKITDTVAHVYVRNRFWKRYLAHEIYHILLFRLEPELPPERHHQRMDELGL